MNEEQNPDAPPAQAAYDPLVEARHLLRSIRSGALATIDTISGHPFVSLTNLATDIDGSPLLLLSSLAAHTKHLEADPRCSLLFAQTGKGDPLTHPRLTLVGTVERTRDVRVRSRFLRRHPKAALYADFGDFSFWRMAAVHAHQNGGFGKAGNFDGVKLLVGLARAQNFEDDESVVMRLNQEHAEIVSLCAQRIAGEKAGPWRATGIDPDGLDLMWSNRVARIDFGQRLTDVEALPAILREMVGSP